MSDTASIYSFTFGNASHPGLVRQTNEDYFGSFDTPNGYLFVVCDGMGGHAGGAKASQIAVNTIRDVLFANVFPDCREGLKRAVEAANKAILQYASEHPELKGMGSTCVAVLIRGNDVYYVHVGDSRIYVFSEGTLYRITKDDSFVQMLVDNGQIKPEEAEHHPRKNEITNALGMVNMNPPSVCFEPVKAAKGDVILLCSDGLTGMVSEDEIEDVFRNEDPPQETAMELIEMANETGGKDNVTVQVIQFHKSEYNHTGNIPKTDVMLSEEKVFRVMNWTLYFIAASSLAALIYFAWPEIKKFFK